MSEGRSLWAGRLPGGLAPEAWGFLHSLPYDSALWTDDVVGTMAHVRGLEAAGVLTGTEARSLLDRLSEIADHPELIEPTDEDVHSAIERILTDGLGPLGAKVHAGRSRNDQVATALRLRTRRQVLDMWDSLCLLGQALSAQATATAEMLAPGYTHLQRAQPVTVGHWLCAHGFAFLRDADRFRAAYRSADQSPLGAGALAGNTLGLDPRVPARLLGFGQVFRNTIDAVSDRDFLLDAAYAASVAVSHLSRLAEEVVLWSSAEFGFLELPDRYATGSSMMPQKRNPDVAELARGQSGPVTAALVGLLMTLKGLPLAYDRDLQADKQSVGTAFEAAAGALMAMAGLVSELGFDEQRLAEAVTDDALLATDLAEALVGAGVPFRTAHEQVGTLSRTAAEAGTSLADALRSDPQCLSPVTLDVALGLLDAGASVQRRTTPGGPSRASVRKQAGVLARSFTRQRELIASLVRAQPTPSSVREGRVTLQT